MPQFEVNVDKNRFETSNIKTVRCNIEVVHSRVPDLFLAIHFDAEWLFLSKLK